MLHVTMTEDAGLWYSTWLRLAIWFECTYMLKMDTVEHQIIHYIKFSWKLQVVKMDGWDSSHSSSAKFKLIVSVVAKTNMFLDLHLYEHLKLGRLWNNSIVILMTREGEKYKLVLSNFKVWITNGEHT